MTRAAMRASQLSGLLLDLAEVKLGRGLMLHREDVDLVRLAREVVAEHESSVPGRAIVFASSGETTASVDPARIGQIFANLIGNAFHHGKPGPDIMVGVSGDADSIEITVGNEGDEIPKSVEIDCSLLSAVPPRRPRSDATSDSAFTSSS
jgi:signal transduction histidine kinase